MIFRGELIEEVQPAGSDTAGALRSLADAVSAAPDPALVTLSLFRRAGDLFVYAESANDTWTPDGLFADGAPFLARWPGAVAPRLWVPMMDIFHYQRCVSVDRWVRKRPPEARRGTVVLLRPEMVSSYIFYHFQMQEEGHRRGDLFGTIGLHENLLFFYVEKPNFVEPPGFPGLLSTKNTPSDWSATMAPHFLPWPDEGEPIWRPCELIAAR
jgi:hypothetical protein